MDNIWNNEEKAKRAEELVRELLELVGENPDREGLKETPKRVVGMMKEVLEGTNYTNEEIAEKFGKCFGEDYEEKSSSGMVVMNDIPIFSFCEHHLALMYNMTVTVAYIPKKKVIGLSKIARIADMVGKRLQLQEKIGNDIAEIIAMATDCEDVAVLIKGEHSCMTARGIKKPGTVTKTSTFKGRFKEDMLLRQELLMNSQI
ncbi:MULTISPECIES: GTP cyclohydrolase I FolE [Clostridium]|uniref:GTP cyclohydrolase I FolE n=1 Tax=Clostridium TaxID=1485 RepID=UPI0006D76C48|nr:GTP cyclohydrolase I FolE [Clostridium massiliamazoniense]